MFGDEFSTSQGSVGGPAQFSMYIDDMAEGIQSIDTVCQRYKDVKKDS